MVEPVRLQILALVPLDLLVQFVTLAQLAILVRPVKQVKICVTNLDENSIDIFIKCSYL